ncbi:uncharacterized protein K441DRAFT_202365 [Cenococcum geophilum 1.58]|uniref:uncharacterized protein n=1 Tax=Cenococcum geophilum 1.58 TaxID=794803 RepID=UPI00358EC42F|nr:hypothetical protein K441DRAFT_202365 [Cenococcum geophilum 1.58]
MDSAQEMLLQPVRATRPTATASHSSSSRSTRNGPGANGIAYGSQRQQSATRPARRRSTRSAASRHGTSTATSSYQWARPQDHLRLESLGRFGRSEGWPMEPALRGGVMQKPVVMVWWRMGWAPTRCWSIRRWGREVEVWGVWGRGSGGGTGGGGGGGGGIL